MHIPGVFSQGHHQCRLAHLHRNFYSDSIKLVPRQLLCSRPLCPSLTFSLTEPRLLNFPCLKMMKKVPGMLLDTKTRFFVMFVGQQDGPRGKRHPRQMTQLHTRQTLNCTSRMWTWSHQEPWLPPPRSLCHSTRAVGSRLAVAIASLLTVSGISEHFRHFPGRSRRVRFLGGR